MKRINKLQYGAFLTALIFLCMYFIFDGEDARTVLLIESIYFSIATVVLIFIEYFIKFEKQS